MWETLDKLNHSPELPRVAIRIGLMCLMLLGTLIQGKDLFKEPDNDLSDAIEQTGGCSDDRVDRHV